MASFTRSFLKQTARLAAVGLAIKVSSDIGVWSTNSEEGASLYSSLKSHVIPGTIVYKEELPSPLEAKSSMVSRWNQLVNCGFACASAGAQWINRKCHEIANQVDIDFAGTTQNQ